MGSSSLCRGLQPQPSAWPPQMHFCPRISHLLSANPGIFMFFEFFRPGLGTRKRPDVSDLRDIAGRALKVGFGRVFDKKVDFSSKFRSPSATYPFWGPWIHEYLSMNASTIFVVCFSSCTRSSNLFSVSQSLPNHDFFKIPSAKCFSILQSQNAAPKLLFYLFFFHE